MTIEYRRRRWPHEPRRHTAEVVWTDHYEGTDRRPFVPSAADLAQDPLANGPVFRVIDQILGRLDAAPKHTATLAEIRNLNRRSTVDEALAVLVESGTIDLRFRLLRPSIVVLRTA